MADLGVMRTPFRGIFMHPFKALMTPFGRICLTLPFEYSEHEEPTRKYVVDRHEACSLRLFFTLTPQAELMEYDVSGYGSGIAMLLERLLNNFDIPARVSQQYVEVPCTYESTVLAQFFLEMLCKVRIIIFSSTMHITMVHGFTGLQLQHSFSSVPTCNEKAMAYRFTGVQVYN